MFWFHSLTCGCPVFPALIIEEAVFWPLYIPASFVKDNMPIHVWVYPWAFCLVPLVCISVFMPVPYYLGDYSFVYSLKSVRLIPPTPFFFLNIALAIWGLLCLHTICDNFVLVLWKIHKDKLNMDYKPKCKTRNYKTPRRKHRQNTHLSKSQQDPLWSTFYNNQNKNKNKQMGPN